MGWFNQHLLSSLILAPFFLGLFLLPIRAHRALPWLSLAAGLVVFWPVSLSAFAF